MSQIFTARKRSLGQGNIFTPVCHSVHGLWGGVVARGACVVAGGCAWLPGGMCGCWGACVVAGGHVWLPGGMCACQGGMCGCQGACVLVGGHA